jgi:hypothetical protein
MQYLDDTYIWLTYLQWNPIKLIIYLFIFLEKPISLFLCNKAFFNSLEAADD